MRTAAVIALNLVMVGAVAVALVNGHNLNDVAVLVGLARLLQPSARPPSGK